jgi:hypothetical protein
MLNTRRLLVHRQMLSCIDVTTHLSPALSFSSSAAPEFPSTLIRIRSCHPFFFVTCKR